MKEVSAYQDDNGRLHKTRRDAIESDFIARVQQAWGDMPDQRDRGDPVAIARILACDTYSSARVKLQEALAFFDHEITACRSPQADARPNREADHEQI